MIDDLGALRLRLDIRDSRVVAGPLQNMTFAVKDMFDLAGLVTGGGNPDWLASHDPAEVTAPAVQACLAAGAHLIGVAIADEMAFSPFGENVHYGTPLNPAAPERVPGGSSSGSASATAGGLVDFALGTDTAGSVRIPASYCGIYGLRPTHGRIPAEGVMPLAPSFDTVGCFARDAALLQRVGRALLVGGEDEARPIRRLLLLEEAFDLADDAARPALEAAAGRVADCLAPVERITLSDQHYGDWLVHFNTLRPPEIWAALGDWITQTQPKFGAATANRFAAVEAAAGADTTAAKAFRAAVQDQAAALLGDDGLFLLPTVPTVAPLKGRDLNAAKSLRENTFRLSGIAAMLGFPEVTIPLVKVDGCPMGLSLMGPPMSEATLLQAAVTVAEA